MQRCTWLALCVVLLTGCPETAAAPQPGQACTRLGDPCTLPGGSLGVCNDNGRTDCADPPCLACIDQH